jgi:hypothetical protein
VSTLATETTILDPVPAGFAGRSGVSWAAIIAGAFVAAAASLLLLAFGGGLEFASISPWPGRGMSGTGFTVYTAIWLVVVQWLSAALGGYIAGRLRARWVGTHTHEVFFRDTAHGLITWSVATVFVAAALASSASALLGGGLGAIAHTATLATRMAPSAGQGAGEDHGAGAPAAAPGALPAPGAAALTYDVDKLFRPAAASSSGNPEPAAGTAEANASADSRVEALYIALHAMATKNFVEADRAYLAQLVQSQTGASAPEAQRRVEEFVSSTENADTRARQVADAARKAAAEASIYTALSMLIGAFIASVSAALGGRLRDEHP